MIKLKDLLFEAGAGDEAKKRGLKSIGFGRYTDPSTGKVVAKSVNGKLVAVKSTEKAAQSSKPSAAASSAPSSAKDTQRQVSPGRQITKAMDRQIGRLGTVAAQVVRQTPSFRNLPEFEVALKNVQLGVADVRDEEQRGAPARRSRPGEALAKLKNDIVALDRHFEKNRNRANLTTGAAATSKLWQLVRKMEQIQT